MSDLVRQRGFTLVELLVALALLVIVIVAMLGLLDSSQRVAKTESALADTQENVRYAVYNLLRTARMAGAGEMPFGQTVSSADYWLAARLRTNQSTFNDDFGQARSSVPGGDVLSLRGCFERSPYFVLPTNVDLGSRTVTIGESNADHTFTQDMHLSANELVGRGLILIGQGRYAVAQVEGNSGVTGSAPDRSFTVTWAASPGSPWEELNPGAHFTFGSAMGPAPFAVSRVGVLDSYTYYVSGEADHRFQLMRVRGGVGTVVNEPVAINIGSLQCALGVDTDGDGAVDAWFDEPAQVQDVVDPGPPQRRPIAIRITVLGRTTDPVPGWAEPEETFVVEDLSSAVVDRRAKWRRMQAIATLRDFML